MAMQPPTVTSELDASPMVSLELCRKHLRVTPDAGSPPEHEDDTLILMYLSVAREFVEGYTGLALTERTVECRIDKFPWAEILLPGAPLISVESVKYQDEGNIQQTVPNTDYVLDLIQQPGWLLPAVGKAWPGTLQVFQAVVISYTIGYSLYSDTQAHPLPRTLRHAVLLMLGHLYENREQSTEVSLQEIPLGIQALCDLWKIRKGMA
jgi:uncharacterized phiE125 gp8 family phage protein